MVAKEKLMVYAIYSKVNGEYGGSDKFLAGLNFFRSKIGLCD